MMKLRSSIDRSANQLWPIQASEVGQIPTPKTLEIGLRAKRFPRLRPIRLRPGDHRSNQRMQLLLVKDGA